jgi:hypothetical protein
MIISIDYDNTYTVDPVLWDQFIKNAISKGHTVYCISARSEPMMEDAKNTIGKIIGPANCFGTNFEPKKSFMWKNHKIKIDVWIDDTPEYITDITYGGLIMPYSP